MRCEFVLDYGYGLLTAQLSRHCFALEVEVQIGNERQGLVSRTSPTMSLMVEVLVNTASDSAGVGSSRPPWSSTAEAGKGGE